jgi:hypothetical protein
MSWLLGFYILVEEELLLVHVWYLRIYELLTLVKGVNAILLLL